MQRKTLLALVLAAALASALLYLLPQPKAPSQPPAQPTPAQQPVEAPVRVNATQPAESERPRPPVIVAVVEAGEGGRVLVNGTEVAVWNSTKPFVLVLEAVPDRCMALDHWLVNGTARLAGARLSLAVAGNTTVRAVFARPLYTVLVAANASYASASINGTAYALPQELQVPACSVLVIEPRETEKAAPLNTTVTILVTGNTTLKLHYRVKLPPWAKLPVVVAGTVVYFDVKEEPGLPAAGTAEVTPDGWIHLNGFFDIIIYVPWNYTRVTVTAHSVRAEMLDVYRYCEKGSVPKMRSVQLKDEPGYTATFQGCQPVGALTAGWAHGPWLDWNKPGALVIVLWGEAWIRITAYP
jgi:hypothetical protein